jgi:hypothetical protein
LVNNKLESLIRSNWAAVADEALADPLVFGDFAQCVERLVNGGEDARLYQDLGTLSATRKVLQHLDTKFRHGLSVRADL